MVFYLFYSGPLTAIVNGKVTLAGIASWGNGCAKPGYPGCQTWYLVVYFLLFPILATNGF